jgi:hypothetical protein
MDFSKMVGIDETLPVAITHHEYVYLPLPEF